MRTRGSVASRTLPVIIVSHNTLWYTRRCIESIIAFTNLPYRVIVVDNGSTDGTLEHLEALGEKIDLVAMDENVGWVKGVNQGLEVALHRYDPEYIVFGNSDIVMGDPLWLERLLGPLRLEDVGAVGPVSNAVMGLQHISHDLPPLHEANFLIGICMAVKASVIKEVGFLDERFGLGGNDDLDLSLSIRKAGYRLMVNRLAFIYHYLSKTLLQVFGGWKGIEKEDKRTRVLLVEKWGQKKVDDLFIIPQELMPSPYREKRRPAEIKATADKVLEDFDDICKEIGVDYRLIAGLCLGFYKYGGYMPWDDDLDVRLVGSNDKFSLLIEKLRDAGFGTEDSEHKYKHFWRDTILLDIFRGEVTWGQAFDTITYNGREYKVPHPIEDYLAECYGENWKTWEPE